MIMLLSVPVLNCIYIYQLEANKTSQRRQITTATILFSKFHEKPFRLDLTRMARSQNVSTIALSTSSYGLTSL